jgi:hypothetical protein
MSPAKEDDLIDADGDGIPDVQQIDTSSLVTRKLRLILNHVDPPSLSQAVVGLYQGFVGMLAVLKFKFAKSVALGLAIGVCVCVCVCARSQSGTHSPSPSTKSPAPRAGPRGGGADGAELLN